LSLARCILQNNKIIIFDESTANIDIELDKFIQKIIREEFVEKTILTIAHRIDTIIDYDKILVVDSGEIIEFASPKDLFLSEKSYFKNLVISSKLDKFFI
jgi:ABC-type multidrug transport system fused ATPase/permease subunit